MLTLVPFMRAYLWPQWRLAIEQPEILLRADPDNAWAQLMCIGRSIERDRLEQEIFSGVRDALAGQPGGFMPTVTLEGQKRCKPSP